MRSTFPYAVALLISQLAFVAGAAWDIQWHYAIGRDRPFIPPHLLLLSGIVLTGAIALAGVLHWSVLASRGTASRGVAPRSTPPDRPAMPTHAGGGETGTVQLLRIFRAPLGIYLAGLGALSSALAFPWDDYWHRIYGIDVTLWAPFHVMIVAGMALAALGTVQLFAAASPAASLDSASPAARVSSFAARALAWATVVAICLLLQAQALNREGIIALEPVALIVFPPLLVGLTVPWLIAAALSSPVAGGATAAALALTLLRPALMAFVPWALRWAAALEGQRIREANMNVIVTPAAFPAWVLVAGVLIDVTWLLVRANRLKLRPVPGLMAAGALAGLALALLDRPWARTLPVVRGGQSLDLGEALLSSLPGVLVVGALGAAYGIGIGGSMIGRVDRRRVTPVLNALLAALGGAAAWTAVLALLGAIGTGQVPARSAVGATPIWLGWAIGLIPVWGLLGYVASQAFAARAALAPAAFSGDARSGPAGDVDGDLDADPTTGLGAAGRPAGSISGPQLARTVAGTQA